MLKQQTVSTSVGELTVSSLTIGELRQLDSILQDKTPITGIQGLLRCMPVVHASVRKIHQDLTLEKLEESITLEDFNSLFDAALQVSGLKRSTAGETRPEPVPAT